MEWKDIQNYEGLYQVSDTGLVRSVDRFVDHPCGIKAFKKGKVLKPGIRAGYYSVILSKEGKHKNAHIHRLVAEAFLPNPNNLPVVNHKDENKLNNSVSNLEWASWEDNANYGTANVRRHNKHTNGKNSKSILQYSLEGEFIKEWPSSMEIQRELGFSASAIRECIRLHYKQMNGFIWKSNISN